MSEKRITIRANEEDQQAIKYIQEIVQHDLGVKLSMTDIIRISIQAYLKSIKDTQNE